MAPSDRLEPADMAKIPFLAGLLPAEVEALCGAGTMHSHPVGGLVFKSGDPGRELCVLIDGEVAIELPVGSGAPRLLATLGAGTVFGEIGYLLGTDRTATARAVRPCRVLAFRRESLESLEGVGRLAATNMMETVARVLALRLSNLDRDLAEICAAISEKHPAARPLLERIDEGHRRVKNEWSF